MRTSLRLAALAVIVTSTALWFFAGPNLGWTKTSVPRLEKDEVAKQDDQGREKRFVPGIDFLGAAVFASSALLAGSCLCRKKIAGSA